MGDIFDYKIFRPLVCRTLKTVNNDMDNKRGQLEPIPKGLAEQLKSDFIEKDDSGVFEKGEILKIRGSKFKVQKIRENQLVLKLLPQ